MGCTLLLSKWEIIAYWKKNKFILESQSVMNKTSLVFYLDQLTLILQHLSQCATEWCGNVASPGAVQLGFHLAFCCSQNEPLCGFLHRPRSEGNPEQRTPQRSRCLQISNQGNERSTPEMLIFSIKETSLWSPYEGFHFIFPSQLVSQW